MTSIITDVYLPLYKSIIIWIIENITYIIVGVHIPLDTPDDPDLIELMPDDPEIFELIEELLLLNELI